MPYEPPPSVWMPGDEAIDHIRTVEKCPTNEDAIEQLRLAIVHRAVGAILADTKKPPIGSSPISVPSDSNPPREMWKTAQINVDGTVLFSAADNARPFKVIRENVLRVWPSRPRSTFAQENRCLKWLIEDLKNRSTKHVSKNERHVFAKNEFGISRRAFERVWQKALEITQQRDSATRPGRKRKNRST
jgi:hypothetical protein